jgi:hypothetical protein
MLALGVMICRQLHSGERFETLLDVMTAGRGGYTRTEAAAVVGASRGARCPEVSYND